MNINLAHWTLGGTGLTNFELADLPHYTEALIISGDSSFSIVDCPMTGYTPNGVWYSLHRDLDADGNMSDCSKFWEIFRNIKYTPNEIAFAE